MARTARTRRRPKKSSRTVVRKSGRTRVRKARSKPKPKVKARSRRQAKPVRRKARSTRPKRAIGRKARAKVPERRASVKPARAAKGKARKPPTFHAPAKPTLDRARRILPDDERLEPSQSTLVAPRTEDRLTSSARAGHDALRSEVRLHTEAGPALTAGDVDAKWQDAYAVGDEAPGGDNPTPDQDRVDDIGKALGIQYEDNQELMGGEEVLERDRHRWEYDPASSEDWPHKDEK